ncbi:MAG: RNA polymerase sigma factor [Acidimicrobiales bacterium]
MVDDGTVVKFRAGDPDAVRAVYRAYGGLVFAVALRVLGNRSLAEEATQQAFLQAWRAAHTLDPSRDLGPWLATIARRAAIDVHRRESVRAHGSIEGISEHDPAALAVADNTDRVFEVWAVRSAIDSLPREESEVVRLQHLDGFTHSQIAENLGIPLGTVKSRSSRAHRRLAAGLGYLREVAG